MIFYVDGNIYKLETSLAIFSIISLPEISWIFINSYQNRQFIYLFLRLQKNTCEMVGKYRSKSQALLPLFMPFDIDTDAVMRHLSAVHPNSNISRYTFTKGNDLIISNSWDRSNRDRRPLLQKRLPVRRSRILPNQRIRAVPKGNVQ